MDTTKSFFAATGVSTNDDLMKAASEATSAMMKKFDAAKKKPKAVIFIERIKGFEIKVDQKEKFNVPYDLGSAIKKASGAAKVFGTGGCGTYGITWGRDIKDEQSSFMVIGLTGADLDVQGFVDSGKLQASGPSLDAVNAARKGDPQGWEEIRRERIQRYSCRLSGEQLGHQIGLPAKPGFIIVMGAVHNSYHVTYAEGLRYAIPPRVPFIGGVGQWEDYVYCAGLKFKDRIGGGNDTVCGRMALSITGTDFDFSVFGAEAVNKFSQEAIDRHTADTARRVREGLGGAVPDAMIAYSCVTRLRDSKVMDPKVLTAMVDKYFFDGQQGELFGCFCGGEFYVGMWGDATAGGDRLVCAAMKAK